MSRFKNQAGGESGENALVFIRPADLARAEFTGVVAEGEFCEVLPNRYEETKNDFKILADVAFTVKGMDKDGVEYTKEVNPGDTVVINNAGNLGYLMSKVTIGELCQVSYAGKKEIAKGPRKGTLAHTFGVAYGE